MYIAKITRKNFYLTASLLKKQWSNEMFSNSVFLIAQKNFLLRWNAHNWINKQISNEMLLKKELEIIDE
jgi:hypothetical protein